MDHLQCLQSWYENAWCSQPSAYQVIAAGFSSSIIQLIVFRALQGLGGSGLYTLTMVIVPEISPPELFV